MSIRPSRIVSSLALLVLLAIPLALVACGEVDEDTPEVAATVTSGPRTTDMRSNKFETPMRVTVGSEVTWVNKDRIAHNVVGDDGAFRSDTLREDDTFTHTFDTPGRFEYTCTFHPRMDGVIEVE